MLHELRGAGRRDAAAVLGEQSSLGNGIQASEEGEPLVEDRGHDMAVTGVAIELEAQQGPHGARGWDHLGPGQADPPDQLAEAERHEHRHEEK